MTKHKRGESPLAQERRAKWTGKKRPRGWRGKVWGLVVHTTGAGLPAKALDNSQEPHERAVHHYLNSHGTHYVISYFGDIIQVANEDMQANGVGMTDQIKAVKNLEDWFSESLHGNNMAMAKWAGRWASPEIKTPLDLYPSKYANSCYVHLEMPPCVFWYGDMLQIEEEPHRTGLRFTTKQHDAVVKLSIDIADRNKFPDGWWERCGRLVGHEDLSPITRGTKAGCWDPGYLRPEPWFDWTYVKEEIEKVYKSRAESERILEEATEEVKNADTGEVSDMIVFDEFVDWVKRILRIKW